MSSQTRWRKNILLVLGHTQSQRKWTAWGTLCKTCLHGSWCRDSWGNAPVLGQQRLQLRVCRGLWEPWHSGERSSPALSPSHWQLLCPGSKTQGSSKRGRSFHSLSQPRKSTRKIPVHGSTSLLEGKPSLRGSLLQVVWSRLTASQRTRRHEQRKEWWRVNTSLYFFQGRKRLISLPHLRWGRHILLQRWEASQVVVRLWRK